MHRRSNREKRRQMRLPVRPLIFPGNVSNEPTFAQPTRGSDLIPYQHATTVALLNNVHHSARRLREEAPAPLTGARCRRVFTFDLQ